GSATRSSHAAEDHPAGVVDVAEPSPGRDVRLDVAGRIGRAGPQGVPPDGGGVPVVGPVLPRVRAAGRLQLRLVPVALAGQTDLDASDRTGSRPSLAPDGAGAGTDDGRGCRFGDP